MSSFGISEGFNGSLIRNQQDSAQDLAHHSTCDIGKPIVSASVTVGKSLVIKPHAMKHRRV
jgi:hypothetical protein